MNSQGKASLMRRKIYVISLTFLSIILAISTVPSIAYTQFVGPSDRVYGYYIDLSAIGVTPMYAKTIDRSRVVVVGSIGGVYGAATIDISNPYVNPIVEDLYPITGMPTCMATDGFPITRIAVGSDKGEILVLRIDRGRITKHTYIVLGADFYVDKIYLVRDVLGNVRILALVVEDRWRGYPCMNCHVYILDEEAQGILRIGPRVGNATWWGKTFEGKYIQDITPLTIYNTGGFYYDASNVIIAHIPQLITLSLNITYINATTGELKALPNTLVEVRLLVKELGMVTVYGVNANPSGVALIPVPLEKYKTIVVNLTIRDIRGVMLWNYSYTLDPKQLEQILAFTNEIPLPPAILPTANVDTRSAEKLYGIPAFLNMRLELFDFASAPRMYVYKGSADFTLSPYITDLQFIKGGAEARAKLVYYNPSPGLVTLTTVTYGTGITRVNQVDDYVGNARIVDSSTYNDGSYIFVGLGDGRIRVYLAEGQSYSLKYIYPMGSSLLGIISIPGVGGYTYVAISYGGIQVLSVEPYPIPIYRVLTQLYLSIPGYVHGDALADLSTIILASSSSLIVVKNSNIAVSNRATLFLSDFIARDVELVVNLPGNEKIDGTIVKFRYPNGVVEYSLVNATLRLKNIIPDMVYSIDIIPAKPYIYSSSITFTLSGNALKILRITNASSVTEAICCKLSVNMVYKEYEVMLSIYDESTSSKLIAPIDIYIDGKLVESTSTMNYYRFLLLYGEHRISVTPSRGYEGAYKPYNTTILVQDRTEVSITLERMRYNVKIKVVDELTKNLPLASVQVQIADTIYIAEPNRYELNVTLPYGNYTVRLRPLEGVYEASDFTVSIPRITSYTFTLTRVRYRVELIPRDPYSITLIAPIDVYINGTLIKTNTTDPFLNVTLPYGWWLIRVAPVKGFEKIYSETELALHVNTNLRHEIEIRRIMYSITLNVVDIFGKIVSPVDINIKGPITFSQTIEPPGKPLYLVLPYGEYDVDIVPYNTSIYLPYNMKLLADSPRSITLTIQRVKYKLGVNVYDRFGLIGRFELRINGTTIANNVGRYSEAEIPYGTYTVQLTPMYGFDTIYQSSRLVTISITSNVNITIPVERRVYNLKVVVMEGTTPVGNAIVDVYNEDINILVTSLPTDPNTGDITTKLPYGNYRLIVKHPQYKDAVLIISVTGDTNQVMFLEPTVTTLILRYLPIIGVLVGASLAVYIITKIRAIMAKRLVEEEMF
uniref:PEGA domain-containing protein n=1 Tax=Ignisphaera aggregans TaxID=334771 RepID=A0A7C4NT27_9CREN